MKRFAIADGAQHIEGAASIGVFTVGTADGVGFASFGVGLRGTRQRHLLKVGQTSEVDGVGRLTLVDIRDGATKGERAALFELETHE